jgi:hypothetical protein
VDNQKKTVDNDRRFTINWEIKQAETRQIRSGDALLMQYRNNNVLRDGTIEEGRWVTASTIPNYGKIYDGKLSTLQKFINLFKKD